MTTSEESSQYPDPKKHAVTLEQLKETEFFYAIFGISPASITILALDTERIVGVNDGFERLFGYKKKEAVNRTLDELNLQIDYEGPNSFFDRMRKGEIVRWERMRVRIKNGQSRHVVGSFFAVEIQGDLYGVIKLVDITEIYRLRKEVLKASQRERQRVGRDLHDGVVGQLSGIVMMLANTIEQLKERCPDEVEKLQEIQNLIQESAQDTRRLSHGLNPIRLSKGHLSEALQELAKNTSSLGSLSCIYEGPENLPELSEQTATHLYWIAQEAVNNTRKHANADSVWIQLSTDEKQLILTIRDNGKGLPAEEGEKGLGLQTMRYRADFIGGHLVIEDAPGGGTVVRCLLSRHEKEPTK